MKIAFRHRQVLLGFGLGLGAAITTSLVRFAFRSAPLSHTEVVQADQIEAYLAEAPLPLVAPGPEHHAYLDRFVDVVPQGPMTLQQLANLVQKATDVTVTLDWPTLEPGELHKSTAVDVQLGGRVTVAELLNVVLNHFGEGGRPLMFFARNDGILITTQERANEILVIRAYDVRDLVISMADFRHVVEGLAGHDEHRHYDFDADAGRQIRSFIVDNVAPESWDSRTATGTCRISYFAGQLVVAQRPDRHDQILGQLRLLRQALRSEPQR
jgi:hypothetical protein